MICRQRDGGGTAAQTRFPIRELVPPGGSRQLRSLPSGVIAVLEFEPGWLLGLCADERSVKRRRLAQEKAHRPAVADHLMQDQKQDVLRLTQSDQINSDQRAAREIEGRSGFLVENAPQLGAP